MDVLTRERAKPTLPFGGCYQLVDIALSNLVHSGITDVWLSVQFQAGSLHRHLARGAALGPRPHPRRPALADARGGRRVGGAGRLLRRQRRRPVALRRLDPPVRRRRRRGDQHRPGVGPRPAPGRRRAPRARVGLHDRHDRGLAHPGGGEGRHHGGPRSRVTGGRAQAGRPVGHDHRRRGVRLPARGAPAHARRPAPRAQPRPATTSTGLGDFGEHLLPRLVRDGTVHAWPLEGYWADLGTPSSFLTAHRDLLAGRVDAVGRADWPVLTRWPELPAARVDTGAVLEDVVVSAGCRVRGTVRRSVLGPRGGRRARRRRRGLGALLRGARSAATRTSSRPCSTRTCGSAPGHASGNRPAPPGRTTTTSRSWRATR